MRVPYSKLQEVALRWARRMANVDFKEAIETSPEGLGASLAEELKEDNPIERHIQLAGMEASDDEVDRLINSLKM